MLKTTPLKSDLSILLRLSLPLALTGIVQSAIGFFQTLFLSRLGLEALAAGSLVTWFFATLIVILYGILSSVNILVSYKHGANDHDGISRVTRDGLILALMLFIPAFVLLWYMPHVFLWLGQPLYVVTLSTAYLHALCWGILAEFICALCFEVIMGLGKTRVILVFSILFAATNIFFNYAFIFGKFGFPNLGVAGAGWGMTVANWITMLATVIYVFVVDKYRIYFKDIFKLHATTHLWELLKLGAPMGGMYCVEVGFFFVLAILLGLINSHIQAANQVVLQYLTVTISVIFSISQAITVRMGYLLGSQNPNGAKKAAYLGITISALFMLAVALVYWFLPNILISVDFDVHDPKNTAIIVSIRKLLFICAIYQIFEAARIAYFGALRGLKDTNYSLLTSVISFWLIGIPVGYFMAAHLKFGGSGYWIAMTLGSAISLYLLHKRFKTKMTALL